MSNDFKQSLNPRDGLRLSFGVKHKLLPSRCAFEKTEFPIGSQRFRSGWKLNIDIPLLGNNQDGILH
jgi:hypothetical protein